MMGWLGRKKEEGAEKPEEPKEKTGFFRRLSQALQKSSTPLGESIAAVFARKKLDEAMLERLEEILLAADFGPELAMRFCAEMRKTRFGKDVDEKEVLEALADMIAARLEPFARPPDLSGARPFVVLLAGVNGAGKTTTLAKIARQWKDEGRRLLMVAGDTFRAAAVTQLQVWAERAGVPVIAGAEGGDAASLAYKGYQRAKEENADILLIDTAGRLHNKAGLMAELEKIVRVLKKLDESAPHAVWLVLDATTGQNALQQVEVFGSMLPLTGLVVTKLDGSAKGGFLAAAAPKANLPVVAIGVGEGIDDLRPFGARDFARALCGLE